MTPEDYVDLVNKIYSLIDQEIYISAKDSDNLAMRYPRLITMYEFFRLLRGESFTDSRPSTPEKQKEFYLMEDKLSEKIKELKNKINFDDERVRFYIEETQKYYLK